MTVEEEIAAPAPIEPPEARARTGEDRAASERAIYEATPMRSVLEQEAADMELLREWRTADGLEGPVWPGDPRGLSRPAPRDEAGPECPRSFDPAVWGGEPREPSERDQQLRDAAAETYRVDPERRRGWL